MPQYLNKLIVETATTRFIRLTLFYMLTFQQPLLLS